MDRSDAGISSQGSLLKDRVCPCRNKKGGSDFSKPPRKLKSDRCRSKHGFPGSKMNRDPRQDKPAQTLLQLQLCRNSRNDLLRR